MENKPTVDIHEELASREGVKEIVIAPYETFQIVQDQRTHEFTGPARISLKNNHSTTEEMQSENKFILSTFQNGTYMRNGVFETLMTASSIHTRSIRSCQD